jgi:hypothetical protein
MIADRKPHAPLRREVDSGSALDLFDQFGSNFLHDIIARRYSG